MTCPDCRGNRFEQGAFETAQLIQGKPALFKSVPGERCVQCGYLLIRPAVMERIEQALRSMPSGYMYAPIYDLSMRELLLRAEPMGVLPQQDDNSYTKLIQAGVYSTQEGTLSYAP